MTPPREPGEAVLWDQIHWYVQCLIEVARHKPVRGLDEAKAGYDAAIATLQARLAESEEKLAWYERTQWVRRLKQERDRADEAESKLAEVGAERDEDGRSVHLLNSFYENLVRDAKRAEAAEERVREARALIEGLLQGGMSAAWKWACKQDGWWYASDLREALGVTPTHADNYCLALVEKGLLYRERSDPSRGGKQFRYRSALAPEPSQ